MLIILNPEVPIIFYILLIFFSFYIITFNEFMAWCPKEIQNLTIPLLRDIESYIIQWLGIQISCILVFCLCRFILVFSFISDEFISMNITVWFCFTNGMFIELYYLISQDIHFSNFFHEKFDINIFPGDL